MGKNYVAKHVSKCVFANIQISTNERFEAMTESLARLERCDFEKWYVNIRGLLKEKSARHLKEVLGSQLILFNVDSGRGWKKDTIEIFEHVKEDYLFYWIEDHFLQITPQSLNMIFETMDNQSVDYLQYSFFGLGAHHEEFSLIEERTELDAFDVIHYTSTANNLRQTRAIELYGTFAYNISLVGIFSHRTFNMVLKDQPYFRLRRWPKNTPFDFEQNGAEIWMLPLKIGVPKIEISCSIDDDNQVPGSSLSSRGLHILKTRREDLLKKENRITTHPHHIDMLKHFFVIPGLRPLYNLLRRLSYHL